MNLHLIQKRFLSAKPKINLLTNLVAYWDMNGNGVDEVSGISPILQTGITYNNPSILGTSSKITAGTNLLRYADHDRFSFTNGVNDLPFTISCWVYFTSFNSVGNWIINKRNEISGGDEWQMIYLKSTNSFVFSKFQFNNNSIRQNVIAISNEIVLNTWYNVVYTDKGTANFNDNSIFINGVNKSFTRENLGGTYTRMNNGISSLGLLNGNWIPSYSLSLQGYLDEVAIWKNRELTLQEITYLYNLGLGRTYPL